jgi:hypothetical protein
MLMTQNKSTYNFNYIYSEWLPYKNYLVLVLLIPRVRPIKKISSRITTIICRVPREIASMLISSILIKKYPQRTRLEKHGSISNADPSCEKEGAQSSA